MDGFIVEFDVRVIYDRSMYGDRQDHVGTVATCRECGAEIDVRVLGGEELARHAREHEPAAVGEVAA